MQVLRLTGRRLLEAGLTLLGASLVVWALVPLAPGDPARLVLQAQGVPEPTPAQLAEVTGELGLDASYPVQFLHWLAGVLTGDLGLSYGTGRPVAAELGDRLPATLRLALVGLALGLLLALALGLVAARWADRWPDRVTQGAAMVGASVPSFVVALLLIQVVVVQGGLGTAVLGGTWSETVLPGICLGVGLADGWSRLLRSEIVGFTISPPALALRARGATPWRVVWRHGLPNSAVPSLHAVAVGVAALIGGAAVVETVFTWPGVGSFVVTSVKARDMPVIQGFTLLATLVYVAASVAADVVSGIVDPRVREGRS